MEARGTRVLIAAAVAAVVATLLYLNLDSGKLTEPAARLFSLPLLGLALIFGVRAWTESMRPGSRMTAFFAGLALGAGGYGIVRLALFR